MKKTTLAIIILVLTMDFIHAQDPIVQPQGNYGLTSILDGAPPGPGFYIMQYFQYAHGTLQDNNGNDVSLFSLVGAPGLPTRPIDVNAFISVTQGIWMSRTKVLGGNIGLNALVPLIGLNVPDYETAPADLLGGSSILGDIFAGPFIQWYGKKYFHRLEVDFILPTGKYEEAFPINVGSGFLSIQPYYAQTIFFNSKVSLSLRHHLTFNTKVDQIRMIPNVGVVNLESKAGTYYHANYSLESVIGNSRWKLNESSETRLAVQGYFGNQLSDDEVNGAEVPSSKEDIFAIGPAIMHQFPFGLLVEAKAAFDVSANNRTKGWRGTVRFIVYFPDKKAMPPSEN